MATPHPYLPESLSLPHYVPNTMTALDILVPFFGATAVILVVCLLIARMYKLNRSDTSVFLWLVSSGLIHSILEAYFGWNNRVIAGQSTFLGQLWKEYSKADSRYVGSDPFVVSMESFTGFVEGPVCLLVAWGILQRAPWRFPIQALVSFGQLYGCILYFATEYLSDEPVGPFGDPLYYWFYYIFMNGLWIIIPSMCIYQSVVRSTQAHAFRRANNVKKNS